MLPLFDLDKCYIMSVLWMALELKDVFEFPLAEQHSRRV